VTEIVSGDDDYFWIDERQLACAIEQGVYDEE